jgi:hypothetical protein
MRYVEATSANDDKNRIERFLFEADEESRLMRAIEVDFDGRSAVIGAGLSERDASLVGEPMPGLDEIEDGGLYRADEITREEFEAAWAAALAKAGRRGAR